MADKSVKELARAELAEVAKIKGAHIPAIKDVEARVKSDVKAGSMVARADKLNTAMFTGRDEIEQSIIDTIRGVK